MTRGDPIEALSASHHLTSAVTRRLGSGRARSLAVPRTPSGATRASLSPIDHVRGRYDPRRADSRPSSLAIARCPCAAHRRWNPRPRPSTRHRSDVSGAAAVPWRRPTSVVETRDGLVAARRNDSACRARHRAAVSDGLVHRVFASFIEPPGFAGSASFEVACDPSFGLRDPYFVYGDLSGNSGFPSGHDQGGWPERVRVAVRRSARGSSRSSADGPIDGSAYELTADRGQQYRPEPIGGGSFHDPQRCGTVEDLAKTPEPSAPASLAAGFGRLVLEPGQVTYNNEPAPTGPVASYPLRIVAGDGSTVYQTQMTGEQSVPVASGTYSIEVEGGLNDCDASVSVKSGTTTVVFIEWFAGGCQITLEAQK